MNLTPENATDAPTTPLATDPPPLLDHERLDVYAVALEFASMVPSLAHGTRAPLRDQLERAAASICLNSRKVAAVERGGIDFISSPSRKDQRWSAPPRSTSFA